MHTDHATLRYLISKKDAKKANNISVHTLGVWIWSQRQKKKWKSSGKYLSWLKNEKKSSVELKINDSFLDEQVFAAKLDLVSWYTDFENYMVSDIILDNLSFYQKRKFLHKVKRYFCNEPYLFKRCVDNIIRRCMPEVEMLHIWGACYSSQLWDIMRIIGLLEWSCKVATIGFQLIRMLMNFGGHSIYVNDRGLFLSMRCWWLSC